MTSQPATSAPAQAEWLAERLQQHKEEVARLRAEIGDPEAALDAWVRKHFTIEAFVPDPPSTREPWKPWEDEAVRY